MNEFLEAFLQEARELVEQASADLLALEQRSDDKGRIDSAFRAFHTLKGSAGIVEFEAMARLLHVAEDALSRVRNGTDAVTSSLIARCFSCLDKVLEWLRYIEAHEALPNDDGSADRVAAAFTGHGEVARPVATANSMAKTDLPQAAKELLETQMFLLRNRQSEGGAGRVASAVTVVLNVLRACRRTADATEFDRKYQECRRSGDFAAITEAIGSLITGASISAFDVKPSEPAAPESVRTLRVDVDRIDTLVKLAGEMTVVRNAFQHAVHLARNGEASDALAALLKNQHAALDRLVDDLQVAVLRMRVLPLRHVFQRFPRLVRDLAGQVGKPVRLMMEGEDTEADKTVVENLAEPLLHVIRNAIDHGIESESQRLKNGKTGGGTIHISAQREGDNVIVTVQDDGAGIDTARIRAIAAERGILPREAITALTDEDVIDLIFMPGFSTASQVTDLSGRGVGMDAVRTAVERLGGRISVQSNAGQGTTVRFSLPFSVMISQVMTATAAGQDFGVPLENVVETVRVPAPNVVPIGEAYAFVLRDVTIPLLDLAHIVGGAKSFPSLRSDYDVMVVTIEGQMIGLVVERLGERLDVMLKPLDGLIAGLPGVAGTTLVADGRVLLVLDLPELLQ